jgi:hypothetical protein
LFPPSPAENDLSKPFFTNPISPHFFIFAVNGMIGQSSPGQDVWNPTQILTLDPNVITLRGFVQQLPGFDRIYFQDVLSIGVLVDEI